MFDMRLRGFVVNIKIYLIFNFSNKFNLSNGVIGYNKSLYKIHILTLKKNNDT